MWPIFRWSWGASLADLRLVEFSPIVGKGGGWLTYLHLPENPMKVFHLLTWYSVTINTLQWRFVEGNTKQKITPKLWILRQDKNRSVLDLFLWNYGCWTYEVHTMSLIWRVIVAISQTMEKKSFPGRAESSDMLWTFRLFTTVHNVFFVQFESLPTEQDETYLKVCVLIYHLSYMSQVVRLEGKHDFRGNRDFETLKGLAPFTYTVKLIKSWVHWPSYLTYFWPFGVILGPCGLFWIISDKIWFFNPNHFAKKHFVFVRQKLKFCLKWSIFQD